VAEPTSPNLSRSPDIISYAAKMRAPAIVHLIGFPAAGKLTIARALADAGSPTGDRFVVLDNHHINNVIFAVLDLDGATPVPPAVWDRAREVRDVVLRSIEHFSPPEWSFVFTNVLTDDKPSERDVVDRLVDLAKRTARTYLAVVLHCDPDALTARVANSDRRERSKWTDPSGVGEFVRAHGLVDVADLSPLTIDTAAVNPNDAARFILQRLANSDL
jgi:chloramphenicol 3-O-phosphotransferase